MPTGKRFRLPARALRRGAALALLALLAVPAAAGAESTVAQVKDGFLRIDGVPATPSMVELRYRLAAEAGFGGVSDRFVIRDDGGVVALGGDCASIDPTRVSCDARPVNSIVAALGDLDDVLAFNSSQGDGVPRRYATDLRGQTGDDVIKGGVGDDLLRGGAGRDSLAGWSGNDLIFGGSSVDGLIGYAGDDTLNGEGGRDVLFGQKGNDLMFGGPQNDILLARDGTRDPQIVCGPGKRQQAFTDRHDPRPRRCTQPRPKNSKKKN
jgi:hypothetical protein